MEAVSLGSNLPILIQTMWKEGLSYSDLEKPEAIISRIEGLKEIGCSLLRFAVPNMEAAEIVGNLASMLTMPLVADIHFDHKIALRCMDFPIAKIRINPGNIGGKEKVRAVLSRAEERNIPIRIGINAGSLPKDLQREVDNGELKLPMAMVKAAERELDIFKEHDFSNVLVSMKASSVADTISANEIFSKRSDVPLHIGVTEAGPLIAGVVRSTAALLELLSKGIGDTIRVSLSDTMEREVIAGREILTLLDELKGDTIRRAAPPGLRIISCPRCGRAAFDTHGFTERHFKKLYAYKKNMSVAIMGCEVNGPGEARDADIGITGAGNRVLIFCKGKIVKTINAEEADDVFWQELDEYSS